MSTPNPYVTVSEKPMLYSAPMVRAILRELKIQNEKLENPPKTQTRRVMKPQPVNVEYWLHGERSDRMNGLPVMREANGKGWSTCGPFKCPWKADGMYASSGGELKPATADGPFIHSRLWVKETWAVSWVQYDHSKRRVRLRGEYAADATELDVTLTLAESKKFRRWERKLGNHTPLFMFRSLSRLTLEIVSVRVERLQEISEADAIAEGCPMGADGFPIEQPHASGIGEVGWDSAIEWYSDLWESLNGPGSWELNPWVWVIEFKKVEGSKLQVAGSTRDSADIAPAINQ